MVTISDYLDDLCPLECRDQYEDAKAYYNHPLRVENRALKEEVLSLKRLLRKNLIPWNSALDFSPSPERNKTRSSCDGPFLPFEIQLKIMKYALTADGLIIDPLCKPKMQNLSREEQSERKKGNQIAIGLLAVCKGYYSVGTRIFWANNEFVFTTPIALRQFSELPYKFRKSIERITLRIVAHYYDDEKGTYPVPLYPRATLWPENKFSNMQLRVATRPKQESTVARGGFRSVTWIQVLDFLNALLPPFDPHHDNATPRPRLLPGLKSMRIDFVSFPSGFLSIVDIPFHSMTFHDLGCTLDELMLTGLPDCEAGKGALSELRGMIKDDGLLLICKETFATGSEHLEACPDSIPTAAVVRSWKPLAREFDTMADDISDDISDDEWPDDGHEHHDHHYHQKVGNLPCMPAAPEEKNQPESQWKNRHTTWKRVPITRDSTERQWVEFSRISGTPIGPYSEDNDEDDIEDLTCKRCGIMHDPEGWES